MIINGYKVVNKGAFIAFFVNESEATIWACSQKEQPLEVKETSIKEFWI